MGPEELRTNLARLLPTDLGMDKAGDAVLDRFQVKLLTEGSGTQIFSTTFAQWTAREALRRAQPLTLLVRFAPRQRQKPMNELLSSTNGNPELDFTGSLVDADMGCLLSLDQPAAAAGSGAIVLPGMVRRPQSSPRDRSIPAPRSNVRLGHGPQSSCFHWLQAEIEIQYRVLTRSNRLGRNR